MMKLVLSVIVFVCVGAAHTRDILKQKIEIFSEILKIKTMEEILHDLQHEVKELKSKSRENVKVAFSSAPSGFGFIGPNNEPTTLVYEHVFLNIGNAYDSSTGIFTAPVKGVYSFIFVVFNSGSNETGVKLLKNGELVLGATDNAPGEDTQDTACNSVNLLLEKGDKIGLQLVETRRIYMDSLMQSSFSGHLLFTM